MAAPRTLESVTPLESAAESFTADSKIEPQRTANRRNADWDREPLELGTSRLPTVGIVRIIERSNCWKVGHQFIRSRRYSPYEVSRCRGDPQCSARKSFAWRRFQCESRREHVEIPANSASAVAPPPTFFLRYALPQSFHSSPNQRVLNPEPNPYRRGAHLIQFRSPEGE